MKNLCQSISPPTHVDCQLKERRENWSKFSKYPEYKDSGVDWLGAVPVHWDVNSIKTLLIERNESNYPVKTSDILSLCMYRGVIPYSEKGAGGNKAKEDLAAYKLAYPGDIVLNSMNVVAGAVGLSKYFGAVSPVYYMLRPRNIENLVGYFNAIFQCESFQKSLVGLGNGILVKKSESSGKLNTIRMRIPMQKLNMVQIPCPTPEEQQGVINFLDYEVSRINALIEEQRGLIGLLNEKRQAFILRAVTKGLNPDVPMHESGVEWLGEVPRHWTLGSLKNLALIRNGKDYKEVECENGDYPVIGSGGQFSLASEFLYDGESVLLGRKGTVDKPLYISGRFWTVDTMFYTEIFDSAHAKFVYYYALTIPFSYYSTSTALPSMTQEDLLPEFNT